MQELRSSSIQELSKNHVQEYPKVSSKIIVADLDLVKLFRLRDHC